MYIGSTGESGLHHLVYEVVDNSVDEALAGYCSEINVTIHIDNSVTVVDNGRGIPVGPHPAVPGMDTAEVVLTKLHAGGKFDKGAYKVSGGLHGVGISVVNALSESLEVEIWRDQKVYRQSYARGMRQGPLENTGVTDRRGTKITFKPDGSIFETTIFSFDTLSQRLRELSLPEPRHRHHARRRARRTRSTASSTRAASPPSCEHLNRNKETLQPAPIAIEGTRDGVIVEVALQWNDGYAENIYSFANNINTHDGGTHLVGFKGALTRTLNNYATASGIAKDMSGAAAGRGHARGADRGHQRQGPQPAVRGADEGQARQLRGEGHRREPDRREARGLLRGEPAGRQAHRPEGAGRRRARARRRARRATSPAARARSTAPACPASSRSARSATPSCASCTWSRATPPAAPPSRAATASSRPSCPCAARS